MPKGKNTENLRNLCFAGRFSSVPLDNGVIKMSNNETKDFEAVRKRIEANVRRIHKNWITEEDVQKLTDSRMAMYKSRQSK